MPRQERRTSKRLPVKERHVAAFLRQRIVSGELSLGSRLKPRRELEQQFKVSSVTVQRALNKLIEDGFVQARGPHGTFVSDNPPHLSRYGLVFPYRPDEKHPWPRFWTALWNEAMRLEQSRPVRTPIYYEAQRIHGDEADHEELANDVDAQRLAGLIFVSPSKPLVNEPFMGKVGLPRVMITIGTIAFPSCVPLHLDMQSFFERAVESLAARGRKRIAILTVPHEQVWDTYLANAMKAARIATRPYWTQAIPHNHSAYAGNAAHLLFHPGQSERPDGLIIADDNLVEHAAAGLLAAGVRVPQDLDVVAHCNHPWPTPSVLPVRRLGFDAREVMRRALETIDEQRANGAKRSKPTVIRAVFDDELAAT